MLPPACCIVGAVRLCCVLQVLQAQIVISVCCIVGCSADCLLLLLGNAGYQTFFIHSQWRTCRPFVHCPSIHPLPRPPGSQVFNKSVYFGIFVEKSFALVNPVNDSLRLYNISSGTPLTPGQVVQVTLQITTPDALNGGIEVVDLLPGGLEAVDPRLKDSASEPPLWQWNRRSECLQSCSEHCHGDGLVRNLSVS